MLEIKEKDILFKRNEWKDAFHSEVQKFPVEATFRFLLSQSALHLNRIFFFFTIALFYLLVYSILVPFLLKS